MIIIDGGDGKNRQSWGEGGPFLEVAADVKAYVSLLAQWLEESLNSSVCVITISYAHPDQWGGVLCWW